MSDDSSFFEDSAALERILSFGKASLTVILGNRYIEGQREGQHVLDPTSYEHATSELSAVLR